MSRKSTTIPREELQPGDTVRVARWWNEIETVEHNDWMSEATFKPAPDVGYLGPRPPSWKNFYGGTVQVMREIK